METKVYTPTQIKRALKVIKKNQTKIMKKSSAWNYKLPDTKKHGTDLILKSDITYINNIQQKIFENKETIKILQIENKGLYSVLIPLIRMAIKNKKKLYSDIHRTNITKKAIINTVLGEFLTPNSDSKLIKDIFYLEYNSISLPFGVNKNQISTIVNWIKNDIISKNAVKSLTLLELSELIKAKREEIRNEKTIAKAMQLLSNARSKQAVLIDTEIVA